MDERCGPLFCLLRGDGSRRVQNHRVLWCLLRCSGALLRLSQRPNTYPAFQAARDQQQAFGGRCQRRDGALVLLRRPVRVAIWPRAPLRLCALQVPAAHPAPGRSQLSQSLCIRLASSCCARSGSDHPLAVGERSAGLTSHRCCRRRGICPCLGTLGAAAQIQPHAPAGPVQPACRSPRPISPRT